MLCYQSEKHSNMELLKHSKLFIRQTHEVAEWFGFESRNKFQIMNESGQPVAFAAEQQKGIFGFLLRQMLGHWRSFDIHFYNSERQEFMIAHHPFRFIFQRLEIRNMRGETLGAIQQRFGFITKKFDIHDRTGQVVLEVRSPLWKPWTFPFIHMGNEVASVRKKWSGGISELFTDRDNFLVDYQDMKLSEQLRQLILAAALFIDLQYFEKKAN